jgi:hypothetical protein
VQIVFEGLIRTFDGEPVWGAVPLHSDGSGERHINRGDNVGTRRTEHYEERIALSPFFAATVSPKTGSHNLMVSD